MKLTFEALQKEVELLRGMVTILRREVDVLIEVLGFSKQEAQDEKANTSH